MADEIDEERKFYTLKPKSFERVNRPVHEEPQGPIDVSAMLQQNLAADVGSKDTRRVNPTSPPNADTLSPTGAAHALPPAVPRSDPQPPVLRVARHGSRRTKDYYTTLACAAGVLAIPGFLFHQSDLVLIGLASAFVLFAVVMAWIFWGVMERY